MRLLAEASDIGLDSVRDMGCVIETGVLNQIRLCESGSLFLV